ncbi:MAG: GNAT family N-acetyltransferase [Sphingobacteriia bacterium]|nr:GNAT family N-acetyltransferase [Sphingobacteriia bacterium]
MENDIQIISLTPENIANYGVCGYKDVNKHKELRSKIAWFEEYYPKGLRIKAVIAGDESYQGMLEYIPGEFAHRPVNAAGYQFIHCIFTGFKNEFKGKGYASRLIGECISEARAAGKSGVAVVTRKGSFMAGDEIFIKNGFTLADSAKPDFNLLVLKFDKNAENPNFKTEILNDLGKYQNGLTIIRSPQCPYTEKNVNAIIQTAEEKYNLKTNLIDLKNTETAQQTPCPFGTFCIIFNGKVISHHPISNTRFENIMNKELKQ